jgi:hypothetical protein
VLVARSLVAVVGRLIDGAGWLVAGVLALGFLIAVLVLPGWLLMLVGILLVNVGEVMVLAGRWWREGVAWLVDAGWVATRGYPTPPTLPWLNRWPPVVYGTHTQFLPQNRPNLGCPAPMVAEAG